MSKYDGRLKEIVKKRDQEKRKTTPLDFLLMMLSGIVGIAMTVFFFSFFVAWFFPSKKAWIISGICIAIIGAYFVLSKINEGLKRKAEDEIEIEKDRIIDEIVDKETLIAKIRSSFSNYYEAQKKHNYSKELTLANEIAKKLEKEDSIEKQSLIVEFTEAKLDPFTDILLSEDDEKALIVAIGTFTEEAVAFYKRLYKRYDVIEINTEVLETLAIIDGFYDPYNFVVEAEE